jgi:hypothetical protein
MDPACLPARLLALTTEHRCCVFRYAWAAISEWQQSQGRVLQPTSSAAAAAGAQPGSPSSAAAAHTFAATGMPHASSTSCMTQLQKKQAGSFPHLPEATASVAVVDAAIGSSIMAATAGLRAGGQQGAAGLAAAIGSGFSALGNLMLGHNRSSSGNNGGGSGALGRRLGSGNSGWRSQSVANVGSLGGGGVRPPVLVVPGGEGGGAARVLGPAGGSGEVLGSQRDVRSAGGGLFSSRSLPTPRTAEAVLEAVAAAAAAAAAEMEAEAGGASDASTSPAAGVGLPLAGGVQLPQSLQGAAVEAPGSVAQGQQQQQQEVTAQDGAGGEKAGGHMNGHGSNSSSSVEGVASPEAGGAKGAGGVLSSIPEAEPGST